MTYTRDDIHIIMVCGQAWWEWYVVRNDQDKWDASSLAMGRADMLCAAADDARIAFDRIITPL